MLELDSENYLLKKNGLMTLYVWIFFLATTHWKKFLSLIGTNEPQRQIVAKGISFQILNFDSKI